jgi:hypothetical protein
MMAAIELRYPQYKDFLASPKRCGMHETVIRSTDGGKTWGNPTLMHQFVAETSMAIDPNDPSHILAITRIQRGLLRGENAAAVMRKTCCPAIWHAKGHTATSVYKNGILLESTDKGRSFSEVKGGMIGFYEHRGTIFWAPNDVIVIVHNGGFDFTVQARISLDGGKTWVDGTKTGTPLLNKSRKFELAPHHSFMMPTVEISPNHFMTAYAHLDAKSKNLMVSGVFWHLEPASGK